MKEKNRPSVSVIIPHYNQNELLERCVASIAQQLTDDDEIIVVDDHSARLPAIELDAGIKNLRIVVLPENRGAASARNAGAEQAIGDYIAFLDADDVALPGRIEVQLKALRSNDDWVGCVGGYVYQRNGARSAHSREAGVAFNIRRALFSGRIFAAGSTLTMKRTFFQSIGGYNPDLPVYEDWDLLLRSTLHSNVGHCGVSVALISPSSRRAGKDDRLKVLDQLFANYSRRIHQRDYRRFAQAIAYEQAGAYFRTNMGYAGLGALLRGFTYAPYTLSRRLFARLVLGRP